MDNQPKFIVLPFWQSRYLDKNHQWQTFQSESADLESHLQLLKQRTDYDPVYESSIWSEQKWI